MYGALTFIIIEVIKQNPNVTYAQVLEFLSDTFDENAATQVKCLNSRTLARLFGHKISQVYKFSVADILYIKLIRFLLRNNVLST